MRWWNHRRAPSVSERRARTVRDRERLAKKGRALSPVMISGRAIATSFWGKAWCENLESYRDYEYRLPRGRSYVRSGAVLDLVVAPGKITALVSGSRPQPYEVDIQIKRLAPASWARVKAECAGEVGSLIELLEGRLSARVMRVVTHREQGLFPKPAEIEMNCSCPDWATMCKHVAAVMYGIGARLDREPQLLFALRQRDHGELIAAATARKVTRRSAGRKTLDEESLAGVFGIELQEGSPAPRSPAKQPKRKAEASARAKPGRRKAASPSSRVRRVGLRRKIRRTAGGS
jgi:uncharacterized Zn finger protein